MTTPSSPQQPNSLGNASLALSIISMALVFGIGLCAITGVAQNWIQIAGTPLFVCGSSSAFLGFLGVVLGLAGLFGKDRSKATSIVGLVLGLIGICMFLTVLRAIGA